MLLNTPDGIVDLRAGTVRKSDPRAYCTKITAVGPRGDCPKFLAFLTKIMGGDEALIAYLRRVFGYCLTGDTSEQAIFFNHGGGQNGKTVLMSTVSGILGDYCWPRPSRRSPRARTTGTRPSWRVFAALVWSPPPRPRPDGTGRKAASRN